VKTKPSSSEAAEPDSRPRSDEDPHSGEEELAEKASSLVAGDQLLVLARAGDDLDRAGANDVEVVGGAALAVEVLALGDRATSS
jgi:hypothetical protein